MIYILISVCLVIAGMAALKIARTKQYKNEIHILLATPRYTSSEKFSYTQLAGLPDPVQRYFRHVIKDGQPYINSVRLTHTGQFRRGVDKPWENISGEEFFFSKTPGFIWKGKTRTFTAIDQYLAGKGRLQVFLLSLFRIVNAKGDKYDQGELLRWLSESPWFPTSLLPSKHLHWTAVDDSTAKLSFDSTAQQVSLTVRFNERDEIAQMETKRYMGEEKLEKWITKTYDYKEWNDIIIPTRAEAIWGLEEGNFSYARFNVETIKYEFPSQ